MTKTFMPPATIKIIEHTDLTCRAVVQQAFEHVLELGLLQPGKLSLNRCNKRLNHHFREGCLNKNWTGDNLSARENINDRRQVYNEYWSHSSLNNQTLAEFAARWRNGEMKRNHPKLLTVSCREYKIQTIDCLLSLIKNMKRGLTILFLRNQQPSLSAYFITCIQ
jgi:hypothetical protein